MQTKKTMNPAGNLLEEMEELKKLVPNLEESVEMVSSQTRECNAFLTLICC